MFAKGNENLIHRMNGMIQTVNNLDFIPPVRTPSDIRTVDWEDWERLLQEIVLHSSYEVLILDMGTESSTVSNTTSTTARSLTGSDSTESTDSRSSSQDASRRMM